MPKMKTNRAAAKRFKVTGSGKIRRSKAGASHLMRGKPAKRLRKLRKNGIVNGSNANAVKRLLPHAF